MRKLGAAIVVLSLAAPVAAAGLSKYKDWADSPQAYFLSSAEREKWAALATDAEAEKFIADYQAARGKGFAQAIQSRIDVAEKTYRTGKVKGAKSPQGRTLVLLGDPTTIEKRLGKDKSIADPSGAGSLSYSDSRGGGGGPANPLQNTGGPGPNTLRGMQPPEPSSLLWVYSGPKLPPGVLAKAFIIEFNDDGNGDVTFKDAAQAEAVFQKVVDYWAPKAK